MPLRTLHQQPTFEPQPLTQEGETTFEWLFASQAAAVLSIAVRMLHDHSEAEEVVQDVFLYILQNLTAYDPNRGSLRAWVLRIAVSRAIDRKLYLARHGYYAGDTSGLLLENLASRGDLDSETETKMSRPRLQQALQTLTPVQRSTIEHFYFDDMDLREISDLLHESLGNVRHHLYRGLARLRRSDLAEKLLQ